MPRISHSVSLLGIVRQAVNTRCLVGTYGVTFDEALTSPGDFIVGDSIELLDQSGVIPVLVKSHDQCKYRIIFDEVDIGAESLDLKIAKSITLMSELGIIVYARILHILLRLN